LVGACLLSADKELRVLTHASRQIKHRDANNGRLAGDIALT
jgi:hypothetical protein